MEKNTRVLSDNRGFSLMELIIALAISSMVILACYSFVAAGTKSYQTTRIQTKLQQEMQLTNNFVGDVIMESDMRNMRYEDTVKASVLYTKNDVLYFDKDTHKFCLYTAQEKTDGKLGTDMDNHIITDCVTEFFVGFVETRDDDDIALEEETTTIEGDDGTGMGQVADTNLTYVEIQYKYKSTEISSNKLYKIRNK